jgi:hypothetical protein
LARGRLGDLPEVRVGVRVAVDVLELTNAEPLVCPMRTIAVVDGDDARAALGEDLDARARPTGRPDGGVASAFLPWSRSETSPA